MSPHLPSALVEIPSVPEKASIEALLRNKKGHTEKTLRTKKVNEMDEVDELAAAIWDFFRRKLLKSKAVDIVQIVCNAALVIVGTWAALIYGGQLKVMSGQLEQAKAMQTKPFVAIADNRFTGNVVFVGGYPSLDFSYSVKNYGTAIAINEGDGIVFLPYEDPERIWQTFRQWCWHTQPGADLSKFSPEQAEMIGSYGRTMMPPGMTIEGGQLAAHPTPLFGSGEPRHLPAFAVEVCISYQGEPSGPMHHTRYLYRGFWGMPLVDVVNNGWSYRQISGFTLERTEAD